MGNSLRLKAFDILRRKVPSQIKVFLDILVELLRMEGLFQKTIQINSFHLDGRSLNFLMLLGGVERDKWRDMG